MAGQSARRAIAVGRSWASAWLDQFLPAARPIVMRRLRWLALGAAACLGLWLAGFAAVKVWSALDTADRRSSWHREPTAGTRGLVVVLHGWVTAPANMRPVADVIAALPEYRDHAIRLHGFESARFSNADPEQLADRLAQEMRALARDVQRVAEAVDEANRPRER